jgi:hypothetical protein
MVKNEWWDIIRWSVSYKIRKLNKNETNKYKYR